MEKLPVEPQEQSGPGDAPRTVDRASRWLAGFLVTRPAPVLAALAASVAVSLFFAARLQFDFTPQAIYRGGDNLVAYAEEFKKTFGYDESVVLLVLEATGDADVIDAPSLEWQAEIARELRGLPVVVRVESLATIEIPRMTWSGLELRPLIEEFPIDERSANHVRGWLSVPSMLRSRLLSQDDRVAAIPIFLDPHGRDIASMAQAVAAIESAVERRPVPKGYRVRFSGLPVLRVEVVRNLRADLARLMPLAGVVYLVVLGLMFRCASGAVLPLAAVGVGVVWTLAMFGATGEPVNVVSNVLPVLLVIVGVSSSVQIVSCYADEWSGEASDLKTSARKAIAHMTPACLLAALTTAVGFFSLMTAHSLLLQDFGRQAALGIGLQYLSTLVVLGALFRYFAPPRSSARDESRPRLITRTASAMGYAVARRPWSTIAAGALVVAGAACLGRCVEINSFAILETFPKGDPAVETLRLVERQLSGIMPLEVSLQADRADEFWKPDVYHRIRRFETAAQQMPAVLAVDSYVDLFREVLVHWPLRRRGESEEELVPPGDAGGARLARTARFVERFPEAFHYDMYISPDGRRARIRLRLKEIGSRETLELIARVETLLEEAFPADGSIEARLTGEAYVNARALDTLIHDLYWSLVTASCVIFGLIAIEFRSLRAGLIAAIPNLTPLAVTLGYMGLRGYDMNVGNVIVFTISLGLADDNTIHFLYRFREELAHDGDVQQAIRRAFLSTGRAIVATSLLVSAGMMVLLFSHFVPTQRFGELTLVTVLGNLLGVLLLLPACLVLCWKPRARSRDGRTEQAAERVSPYPLPPASGEGSTRA